MRAKPLGAAEQGRVIAGRYATTAGSCAGAFFVLAPGGRLLRLIASNGADWRACGLPGDPWEHVSVSLAEQPNKCPSWPEMDFARSLFWTDDELVVQFHPPASIKINRHAGCLHMWRPTGVSIPLPPLDCV